MLRTLPLLTLGLLAACTGGTDDWPNLLPTQQILAEPALPDHAAPATTSEQPVRGTVESQGAATRAAAQGIPDPVDNAALAARAADLRRRAEALRNAEAAPPPAAETPDCTPGDDSPDCPKPAP